MKKYLKRFLSLGAAAVLAAALAGCSDSLSEDENGTATEETTTATSSVSYGKATASLFVPDYAALVGKAKASSSARAVAPQTAKVVLNYGSAGTEAGSFDLTSATKTDATNASGVAGTAYTFSFTLPAGTYAAGDIVISLYDSSKALLSSGTNAADTTITADTETKESVTLVPNASDDNKSGSLAAEEMKFVKVTVGTDSDVTLTTSDSVSLFLFDSTGKLVKDTTYTAPLTLTSNSATLAKSDAETDYYVGIYSATAVESYTVTVSDAAAETSYTVVYDSKTLETLTESKLETYKTTYGLTEETDYSISETTVTLTETGYKKVSGANGTYNLVKSDDSSDTWTATDETKGIYNYTSKDEFVTFTGLDTKSNNKYGVIKSSTATIKVSGPSRITWTGANGGTRTTFTVTDGSGNTIVDSVTTSYADNENLYFIYTGTDETTLTLTWGDKDAYIKTLIVESIESTETNSATAVTVTGDSTVISGTDTTLTATVTPKYLNTDSNALSGNVTWASSETSYATVTETSVLNSIDKSKGLYSATTTVSYVAEGSTNITAAFGGVTSSEFAVTASATELTYSQYSWNFLSASEGTSWASSESSSVSITSTTSWNVESIYGIYGSATTLSIPVTGAATVIVFVTYQGNNPSTIGLYNGSTQIGSTSTIAVADTKAGKPYVYRYTGTDETTLSLKIADSTSGSAGTTYIGSIFVDYNAIPSSVTSCTYDLTDSSTFDGSVAASAGSTTMFWHKTSNNGYLNSSYGLQENNGTYLVFPVGGACKIILNVSCNGSSSQTTATLYNSDYTSQGTATIAASLNGQKSNPTGYDISYSGDAGFLYLALPAAGTCVSSVVVSSN